MTQRIYRFSQASTAGDQHMTALLGGKGANLAAMCQLGLPVPPGFTITTAVCNAYRQSTAKDGFLTDLTNEALTHVLWLAEQFGYMPLLSVRSGAPVSMPGMMDTILNVGLCTQNWQSWIERIGGRAVHDCDRRLTQMLGSTAYGVPAEVFEFQLAKVKKKLKVEKDTDLDLVGLSEVVLAYRQAFEANTGFKFPFDDPEKQLRDAIKAVFDSWMSPRAVAYRQLNGIDEAMGTAVTIQAMVFGNMGNDSGTGVLFTRDPLTGKRELFGEFLQNAQGEDVVAGIRTPLPFSDMGSDGIQPQPLWGEIGSALYSFAERLEQHYRDMMDIEFTVQRGKLWLLQCRPGKRSAAAAFRIAVDLVDEEVIDAETAFSRLSSEQYKMVRRPRIADGFDAPPHSLGIAASPGVATGRPVFSAEAAVNCTEPCIMITEETSPDDIAGMAKAVGVLTRTGGTTSHAAVVARAMDKPCVVGCTALDLDPKKWATTQRVTIDGATGRVWCGIEVPLTDGSASPAVLRVQAWAVARSGYAVARQISLVDPTATILAPHRLMAADWWGDHVAMHQVLDALTKLPDRAYTTLDLTPPGRFRTTDDELLQACFGEDPDDGPATAFLIDLLKALVNRSTALEGLAMVLDGDADPALVAGLKSHGFRLAVEPATVADLLSSDVLAPGAPFIEEVIGGIEAWDELLALFAAGGKPIGILPPAAPAEYLVFTQLGV